MLAKLMKYELKATSRLLVPLYSILLLMSIINRFVFNLNSYKGEASVINQFLIFTFITSIVVVLIVTAIYMIVRFYKNLLTDEGYLMFTLPAETHQHITSKLLITLLWIIIGLAAISASLYIVFATNDSFPSVISGVNEIIGSLKSQFNGNWTLAFTESIIIFLLSMIAKILLIYLSIAVGQLFSKHKIIASFAAYMVIYTVLQFIAVILLIPFGIFMSNNPPEVSSLPLVIFPIAIVVLLVGCACFYLGTNYIFKRKLNLD